MSFNAFKLTPKLLTAAALAVSLACSGSHSASFAKDSSAPESAKPCPASKPCSRSPRMKCGHPPDKEAMMADFEKTVGVNEEQKKKLEAIRQEAETQNKPLMESLSAKHKALFDYMAATDATEAEALAKQTEINDLQAKLSQQHIRCMFRMKAVLTPEQQQKAAQMMRERMAKEPGHCHHDH